MTGYMCKTWRLLGFQTSHILGACLLYYFIIGENDGERQMLSGEDSKRKHHNIITLASLPI